MIIFDQNQIFIDFASHVLKVKFDPSQSTWISRINKDGSILVVVVFTRFSPHNCEMSIASDGSKRWFSKEFVRACYAYAFIQMGLSRITVVVEDDNKKSLKMCRQLGHVQEGILESWFGDKNGVLFRMKKSECKWL